MAQKVVVTIEEPLARICLHHPEKRNALSLEMMHELIAAFDHAGCNRQVRAVIVTAAGKVFCSGHDLAEMAGRSLPEYRTIFDTCTELMEKIQAIPQPVIAQVQGVAAAAGCQLVATCDLAVASEHATFATPGVKIGLFCTTPMVALTRAIGRKRALEMLLTGAAIDARTAVDWGLINRVVPDGELERETRTLAERCADASGFTVATGKHAFYKQIDLPQAEAYRSARDVMSCNAAHEDAQEGIAAFLEKRRPSWRG